MMFDYLTMIAGVDVPVTELQVNLHQPKIKEIAIIGEQQFYKALSLLNINKDKILENLEKIEDEVKRVEGKTRLSNMTTFDILLEMIAGQPTLQYELEMILLLVMPEFHFAIEERFILANSATREQPLLITSENFDALASAILSIFCINCFGTSEGEFNPANEAARKIAEKIRKGREKARKSNGETDNNSILGNYISSLGIGSNSINILNASEFTVFQLTDQMKRFGVWTQYQQGVKASLAGAKDVEIVDWLKSF